MNISRPGKLVSALVAFSLTQFSVQAGERGGDSKAPMITAEQKTQVLSTLSDVLVESYVHEDQARTMSARLKALLKQSNGKKQENVEQFSERLSAELQEISGDKHLRVEYSAKPLSIPASAKAVNDYESDDEKAMWRSNNLGFDKLERLPFNIGYMKLVAFAPVHEAAPMLASAFTFLNNSNSLIIDLRGNFGGFEYTGMMLTSYFLTEKTHLMDMYWRKDDRLEQRWSSLYVDGPKYGEDKKVYILVDKRTFSAGEAFAYTMKHLGRATIIGEHTAGAGNAGEFMQLSPHFKAFIPMRRVINPITNSNFEGKGVVPDVEATSDDALKVAQVNYLESIKATENNPRRVKRIEMRLASLNGEKQE